MYGTGREPFIRAGALNHPELQIEYQNRLREIRDLLYNPGQTGALLDELVAAISDPGGGTSFVAADRAKWDYHPIMTSRWVNPVKAGPGKFYEQSPTHDFSGMIKTMKDYVVSRGQWCDQNVLTDKAIPPTPVVKARSAFDLSKPAFQLAASFSSEGATQDVFEWRMAEVSFERVHKTRKPAKYEIESLWQQTGTSAAEVPSKLFEKGHTYRIRARARDASGRCSHWSEPVEVKT
jgi:hypothetical protein